MKRRKSYSYLTGAAKSAQSDLHWAGVSLFLPFPCPSFNIYARLLSTFVLVNFFSSRFYAAVEKSYVFRTILQFQHYYSFHPWLHFSFPSCGRTIVLDRLVERLDFHPLLSLKRDLILESNYDLTSFPSHMQKIFLCTAASY